MKMDLAKPPDRSSSPEKVGGFQDETQAVEGLGKGSEKFGEIKSRDSKKVSWVEVAQERKVLRRYDLQIIESEGQKSVEIPDEVIKNVNPLWEDYLIGKFLDIAPHVARVHAVVNKIWSYGDRKQVIDIQVIDETTIKFRISSPMVRAKVFRRCMWNIGNVPMVITKWVLDELEEKPEVKSIPLWVHLKRAPMHMFSWEGLSFIASAAGFPIKLHPETASCSNFKIAKIFVNVDLTKELPEKINFTKNGETFMVEFIYPWLPKRCNTCSKWSHEEKVCVINKKGGNVETVQEKAKELAQLAIGEQKESVKSVGESSTQEVEVRNLDMQIQNGEVEELEEGQIEEKWSQITPGKSSSPRLKQTTFEQVKTASRFSVLSDLEETEKPEMVQSMNIAMENQNEDVEEKIMESPELPNEMNVIEVGKKGRKKG